MLPRTLSFMLWNLGYLWESNSPMAGSGSDLKNIFEDSEKGTLFKAKLG